MPETRKLSLRLPADLHAALIDLAAWECASANAVLIAALRNWITYRNRLRRGPAGLQATTVPTSARSGFSRGTVGPPGTKVGRNDPCPCGSGQKFKKCCGAGPLPA
ncbi:MAG TPA: SEC-C metal-binding domain-containing protein [Rhodanobacteraceae bacterium]|nr:SEC-C metal-binding domain-containing protein [Rhodanobacteraceae bacterium]